MIVIVERNETGMFLTTAELDADWMIIVESVSGDVVVRNKSGAATPVDSVAEAYSFICDKMKESKTVYRNK